MNEDEKHSTTVLAIKNEIFSSSPDSTVVSDKSSSSTSSYAKSSGHDTSTFGDIESTTTGTPQSSAMFCSSWNCGPKYSDISSSSEIGDSTSQLQHERTDRSSSEPSTESKHQDLRQVSTPSPVARRDDEMHDSDDSLSYETIPIIERRRRVAAIRCLEKLSKSERHYRQRKLPAISIIPPKREFPIRETVLPGASNVDEKSDCEIDCQSDRGIDQTQESCDSHYELLTYFVYNETIREVRYFGFYTECELSLEKMVNELNDNENVTLTKKKTIRRFNPPSLEYDLQYGIVPLLKMVVADAEDEQEYLNRFRCLFKHFLYENMEFLRKVLRCILTEKYPSYIVDIVQSVPFALKGTLAHFYVSNSERLSNNSESYFDTPSKQLNLSAYITSSEVFELPEVIIILSMLLRFMTQLISSQKPYRDKPFLSPGELILHFGEGKKHLNYIL
jgi:hypothetical protein